MDQSHIIEFENVHYNQQQPNDLLGTPNLVTVPENRANNVASGSFQLLDYADDSSGSDLSSSFQLIDNRVNTPDDWEECLSAIEAGTMKIDRLLKKRKTARILECNSKCYNYKNLKKEKSAAK
jgi:hypothetical protein